MSRLSNSEYVKLSERTLAEPVLHISGNDIHLLHGAIGIVTEVGELVEQSENRKIDIVNVKLVV